MKFIAACVVIILLMGFMGLGMGLLAHGHGAWLLGLGVVIFFALFIRYGCRTH